jgi:hypothetical protein
MYNLKALALREDLIKSGKLATIVFIRDYNMKGQEVSGYLDLTQRMKTDDFEAIFNARLVLFNLHYSPL